MFLVIWESLLVLFNSDEMRLLAIDLDYLKFSATNTQMSVLFYLKHSKYVLL